MAEIRAVIEARNAPSLRQARAGVQGLSRDAQAAQLAITGLVGALGVASTARVARGLLNTADTFTRIRNSVRTATSGAAEFNDVYDRLQGVAERTRASLESSAQGFQLINLAIQDTDRSITLVQALNQAVALTGGGIAALTAVTRQFGQAAGEGIVRAQEFNSLLENASPLVRAVATEMGLTVGELRRLVVNGELLFDDFAEAAERAAPRIAEAFERAIPTIEQRLTQLSNEFTVAFGEFQEAIDATTEIGAGIQLLANNMDSLLPIILGLGAALATLSAVGFTALIISLTALAGPVGLIALLATGVGALTAAFVRNTQVANDNIDTLERLGMALRSGSSAAQGLVESLGAVEVEVAQYNFNQAIAQVNRLERALMDAEAAQEAAMGDIVLEGLAAGDIDRIERQLESARDEVLGARSVLFEARRRREESGLRIETDDDTGTTTTATGTTGATGPAAFGFGDFQRDLENRRALLGLAGQQREVEREIQVLRERGIQGRELEQARALLEEYHMQREAIGELTNAAQEFGDTFTNALSEAFTTGEFNLRSFASSLFSQLSSSVIRQNITNPLTSALFGAGSGVAGSTGVGLLGGLFGFRNGGSLQLAGSFQGGGSLFGRVGGPDSQLALVRLSPNERVDFTPAGSRRGGEGRGGTVINLNFPDTPDVAGSIRRSRVAVERELRRVAAGA